MPDGKVRYALMCNDAGGVIDDLLVYKVNAQKYYIVVNASNIDKDRDWILSHLAYGSVFSDLSEKVSMIAVQGPCAESLTGELFPVLPKGFYTFIFSEFQGKKIVISRTGYTGEDGFEIYSENDLIVPIFDEILKRSESYGVSLCGLGARDTLRLESAMPLYGHEMNETTLATELGLDAYIKKHKSEFIGKTALLEKKPRYRRVGIKLIDKGIAREHSAVFSGETVIGEITSGTMSPTLGIAIAMARIEKSAATDELTVDVRGKRLRVEVTAMPFYKRVKRG